MEEMTEDNSILVPDPTTFAVLRGPRRRAGYFAKCSSRAVDLALRRSNNLPERPRPGQNRGIHVRYRSRRRVVPDAHGRQHVGGGNLVVLETPSARADVGSRQRMDFSICWKIVTKKQ